MRLWHDQCVAGIHRIDIQEAKDLVVFIDLLARDLSLDDSAKEAVIHNRRNRFMEFIKFVERINTIIRSREP